MYTKSPHYLYQRNGTFYFSRQVPSDLQTRFNKKRVVISLRTLSEPKALKSAIKLADRLETYWSTLRLELFHTKELKLSFLDNEKIISEKLKLSDALNIYLKLKGKGKDVLFARTANRNISNRTKVLIELNYTDLPGVNIGKMGQNLNKCLKMFWSHTQMKTIN